MEMETGERRKLPRNEATRASHRREVLWQVTVPLAVGILLILLAAGGIIYTGVGDASLWADISTIWLLLPVLFLAIIPLVILIGLIYGITWLVANLPGYALMVQQAFRLVEARVQEVADRVVEPALKAQSSLAALRALRSVRRPDTMKEG